MGYYTKSMEMLNAEYCNRASLSLIGHKASALRLLADSLLMRRQFDNLFEKLKQAPMLIEDGGFDFLGWADEVRWLKPEALHVRNEALGECFLTEQMAECLKRVSGGMFSNMNNGRLDIQIEETEIELLTDEIIHELREMLMAMYHFKKNHRWDKESYAEFYRSMYQKLTSTEIWKEEIAALHERWRDDQFGSPSLDDLRQRRRELLISLFGTGFLDVIRRKIFVPAPDDLCFGEIKDEQLLPDLNDTLKWMAALQKLCPLREEKLHFNEHALMGKYIYDNNISQQTCRAFFRFLFLIDLVQTEIGWLTHPETKPLDEDTVVNKFIDRVKMLACKATEGNNTKKQISSRGRTDYYIYKVDAQGICRLMDELKNNHMSVVKAYLKDSTHETADSIKYVAPFMGFLLDTHAFTARKMPKKDFDRVFRGVYGNNTSAVSKMSNTKPSEEAKNLFDAAENIMKTYSIP